MALLSAQHTEIIKLYNKEIGIRNLASLKEMKNKMDLIFGADCNQIIKNNIFKDDDGRISTSNYLEMLRSRIKTVHYTITIHFPEFTIRNHAKKTRIIRDLYVRFYMSGELKLVLGQTDSKFVGLRTTYTPEEWTAGYAHSHLPGKATTFMTFCTGSGPINQHIALLSSNYSTINFNMFLLAIKIYVAYESVEGTPHRYMDRIGIEPVINDHLDLSHTNYQKLYTQLYVFIINEYRLLNYSINNSGVVVTSTDAFDITIAEILYYNFSTPAFQEIFGQLPLGTITPYKTSDNRYYTSALPSISLRGLPTGPLIEFKGVEKTLLITNSISNNANTTNLVRHTHPRIIQHICRSFTEELTKKALSIQNAAR